MKTKKIKKQNSIIHYFLHLFDQEAKHQEGISYVCDCGFARACKSDEIPVGLKNIHVDDPYDYEILIWNEETEGLYKVIHSYVRDGEYNIGVDLASDIKSDNNK